VQADFGSSLVINGDHWLYWGERTLLVGSADEPHGKLHRWQFTVIEQTEFVDDESFQALNAREAYVKRACHTKLHSPQKLAYMCPQQVGCEREYLQTALDQGTVS
jgi:hypothetical protein